jgi:hypothetical protein
MSFLNNPIWRPSLDPGKWRSAINEPPEVRQYLVRKYSNEHGSWMEATAYYFGGRDQVWRLLQLVDGKYINAGPVSAYGLEYYLG